MIRFHKPSDYTADRAKQSADWCGVSNQIIPVCLTRHTVYIHLIQGIYMDPKLLSVLNLSVSIPITPGSKAICVAIVQTSK